MAQNAALSAYKAGVKANDKKRVHHKAKHKLSLGIVAGFVPLGGEVIGDVMQGNYAHAKWAITNRLTGYNTIDHRWHFGDLLAGWSPILAGVAVHKVAGMTGLNRQISKLGLPIEI